MEERRKRPIILPPPAPFPNIWSSEQAEKNSIQKKKSDNVGPIKKKIDEAKTAIDNSQLNDAKRIYINIMKTYLSLNPKEQSEIYNDIKELYIHRKSKEKIINKSS